MNFLRIFVRPNPVKSSHMSIKPPPGVSHTQYRVEVSIPVLPFVKKILIAEYGPEPILITRQTLAGKHMMTLPFDIEEAQQPEIKVYGEQVRCLLSKEVKRYVITKYYDLFQAGYFFEKMAQRMLVAHIRAQVRTGIEAWKAMDDFFTMYDIGEDDYSYEAAYEYWKAYKKGQGGKLVLAA